jgi:methionyl aminopeptidase
MSSILSPFKGLRESIKLGRVSGRLPVPSTIRVPPYVGSQPPPMESLTIKPKEGVQLAAMRDACTRAATALQYAGTLVRAGVTTDEIDCRVHEFIVHRLGCYPSPLGYAGFPKSICTSINEIMCHGIPDDRPLCDREILNIDVSLYTAEGYHGDCSDMFVVGDTLDDAGKQLIDVTRGALNAAIAVCRPGVPFKQIGTTITKYVAQHSAFRVVEVCAG